MWQIIHQKQVENINIAKLWAIWTDIDNYKNWHDDLAFCELVGAFQVGNHFKLQPKGGPTFKVHIVELINDSNYKRFTDCTHFIGAKMYDIHELRATDQGLLIIHTLKVTGWLSKLWVKRVAQKVAQAIPGEMEALVKRGGGHHA